MSGRLKLICESGFFFDLDLSEDIKNITVEHMHKVIKVDGGKRDSEISETSFNVIVVVLEEEAWVELFGEGKGSRQMNLPTINR